MFTDSVENCLVNLSPADVSSLFQSRATVGQHRRVRSSTDCAARDNHNNNKATSRELLVESLDLSQEEDLCSIMSSSQGAEQQQQKQQQQQLPLVDPYKVLQIRRDATKTEIRHAYKRLALWHHPGRAMKATMQERARRRQVFEVLAACYETLMDKQARKSCDVLLKELDLRKRGLPVADIRVKGKSFGGSGRTTTQQAMSKDWSLLPTLSPVSSQSDGTSVSDEQTSSHDHNTTPGQQSETTCHDEIRSNSRKIVDEPLSILVCGKSSSEGGFEGEGVDININNSSRLHSLIQTSSTTTDDGDIHYTEHDTNRLFGGPLQLLFRARRWKPFTDPFEVFAQVFGSHVQLGSFPSRDAEWKPLPSPKSTACAGSSRRKEDGTVVYTMTRTMPDRILIRSETIRTDETGRRHSYVTVTSEPLQKDEHKEEPDKSGCIQLDMCIHFIVDREEESKNAESSNGCRSWSPCNSSWLPECA